MDEETKNRIQVLQARIDAALSESPEARSKSRFSPYLVVENSDLESEILEASKIGGLDGMEAVMDKFEELAASEDGGRVRYELMRFLAHDPTAAKFGLRIPSLEQRSAWKIAPSRFTE
jgi:hypothetical protein